MDLSTLGTGAKIAGGAGLVLLISLFLPWYGVDVSVGGLSASESVNAWESLSFIDLVVFVAAVGAIAVAVLSAQNRAAALPVPPAQLLLGLGGLAAVLIAFRILSIPGPDVDVDGVDLGRKIGVFIAFIAAAAVAYAGKVLQDGD